MKGVRGKDRSRRQLQQCMLVVAQKGMVAVRGSGKKRLGSGEI